MGPGVFKYAVLIQVAVSMLRRHGPFCDEIAFRCGAEFGMQRAPVTIDLGFENAVFNPLGTRALRSLTLRSVQLRMPPFESRCLAIWQCGAVPMPAGRGPCHGHRWSPYSHV